MTGSGIPEELLTNLRSETDRPILWLWMALAGFGIGPSFAVFTLIVQNAVAPDRIGVATSSLTFFQQIGGTVGLTVASTIFAGRPATEIPNELAAFGVPGPLVSQFAGGGGALDVTGTGGQRILTSLPDTVRPTVEPLIPAIVGGIHEAFSIALASAFWVGIGGDLSRCALPP